MSMLLNYVKSFARNEEGQDLLEYALLVALIALIAIGAVGAAGGSVQTIFQSIADQQYPPYEFRGEVVTNPTTQWALPLLREGDVALNFGHWLGLRGLATLLPLAAGAALVVLATVRGRPRES